MEFLPSSSSSTMCFPQGNASSLPSPSYSVLHHDRSPLPSNPPAQCLLAKKIPSSIFLPFRSWDLSATWIPPVPLSGLPNSPACCSAKLPLPQRVMSPQGLRSLTGTGSAIDPARRQERKEGRREGERVKQRKRESDEARMGERGKPGWKRERSQRRPASPLEPRL